MLAIMSFFTSRLFFTLIGLVAISLLIWFLGPRIGYGGTYPLADEVSRIATIVAVIVMWLIFEAARRWRLRLINQRMIESLADAQADQVFGESRPDDEAELVRERFERAMAVLGERTVSGRTGGRYAYDLPWYVLIGAPGSGKTTVLSNSGLEFPLANELGVEVLEGFGGTRSCDWWFTDEAVLIDTAGRYTTQNVNPATDRTGWTSVLQVLKEYRNRRPINGVLVAVGMDLLLGDEAERRQVADAIRARIQEVMSVFHIRPPIYVLVTKCDLIDGFTEYFDDLDGQERDQLWGIVLPHTRRRRSVRPLDEISSGYDDLVRRLVARLPLRLEEERDADARKRLFGFPQQMSGIKRHLDRFLGDVFRASRYASPPMLRGVFLTSGVQEGIRLDALMQAHAGTYDVTPSLSVAQEPTGRSFFIHGALRDVLFPEQHLVGSDRSVERRLLAYYGVSYAAIAGITAAFVGGWHLAVAREDAMIERFEAQVATYDDFLATYKRTPTFEAAIDTVTAVEPDDQYYGVQGLTYAFVESFGLLAPAQLVPKFDEAFGSAAKTILVPAVVRNVRNQLTQAVRSERDNLDDVRRLLKLYLGFGDIEKFDRAALDAWFDAESQKRFGLRPEGTEEIVEAYEHAFEEFVQPVQIDAGLVSAARQKLFSIPPAKQIYSQLKDRAAFAGISAVSLQTLLGARDSQIFEYQTPSGDRPPLVQGLYTDEGFYSVFLKDLPGLLVTPDADDALAGGQTEDNQRKTQKITSEISDLYTNDYVAAWNEVIDGIHLTPFRNIQEANAALTKMSAKDSPLVRLLNAVANNTILPVSRVTNPGQLPTDTAASGLGSLPLPGAGGSGSGGAATAQNAAAEAALARLSPFSRWPGVNIARPFQSLHDLVIAQDGRLPEFGVVQQKIVDLYGAVNLVATAPDVGKAAFDEVRRRIDDPRGNTITALSVASISQPSPLREILKDMADGTWDVLLAEARGYLDAEWSRTVANECERAIARRYPVDRNQQTEINLVDFGTFFSTGGTLDTYFKTYLEPFVDTTTTPWSNRVVDGRGLDIAAETLAAFTNAQQIQKAFFKNGGPTPAVDFVLRPSFLDANAARIAIEIGKTIHTYRHEPPRDIAVSWPTTGGADKITVTITDLQGSSGSTSTSGPWAWFRLFDSAGLAGTGQPDQFILPVRIQGLEAQYDLNAESVVNPFDLPALSRFRCLAKL